MIKDKINNTIEQFNKQFTDFQNKIKSVKALTIYSQEEINRRTEAIYKQYEETVSSAIDNLEKSVKSCIDIEVNKLTTDVKNNETHSVFYQIFILFHLGSMMMKHYFCLSSSTWATYSV